MEVEEQIKNTEEEMKNLQEEFDRIKRANVRKDERGRDKFRFCPFCMKLFSTVTSQQMHMKKHSESKVRQRCKYCRNIYVSDKDTNVTSHFEKQHPGCREESILVFTIGKTHQKKRKPPKLIEDLEAIGSSEDESDCESEDKSEDESDGVNDFGENLEEKDIGKDLMEHMKQIVEDDDNCDEISEEEFIKRRKRLFG